MTFPVYIDIGPLHLHPHAVFDFLAYIVGGQTYWKLRRQERLKAIPFEQMMWVLVGMAGGAMLGAKMLAWAESWPLFYGNIGSIGAWIGGKTIVGGLIGGWAGVEIAKRFTGVSESTGDSVVFAVIVGIVVGRIGCFLTGVSDATCGSGTSVPWGMDFGDGVLRHPTQLYEIALLLSCGAALWQLRNAHLPSGVLFRLFMSTYLLFRFGVEFVKPRDFRLIGPLSPIQIASLGVGLHAFVSAWKLTRNPVEETEAETDGLVEQVTT